MAQTFLRGLALLEYLDQCGPCTVTELSGVLGVDKATASRLVAAAEVDGWVIRDRRRVGLGPRVILLGRGSGFAHTVRRAEELVHSVAGVTGLTTQALGLIGGHTVALAGAGGRVPLVTGPDVPAGLRTKLPIWAGAGSKVIAAQLSTGALDAPLPPDPLPNPRLAMTDYHSDVRRRDPDAADPRDQGRTRAATRRELDRQLTAIRRQRVFLEIGDLLPDVACVAVPWPGQQLTASLACIGPVADISDQAERLVEVLHAAAAPGTTSHEILTARST